MRRHRIATTTGVWAVAACLLGSSMLLAQTGEVDTAAATSQRLETSVQSLEALYRSIQAKKSEVEEVQGQLQAATDDITREDLLERLKTLMDEAEQLDRQFTEFSAAVDLSLFTDEEASGFDWQEEVGAVLQPIISEVKSATAESRIVAELRSSIDDLEQRFVVADAAVQNLQELLAAQSTPALDEKLGRELQTWSQWRDDAANRKQALNLQLQNRLAERKSLLDSTTGYVQTFVRTRGLNLILGIGSFCLVFFGLRFLGAMVRKIRPPRNGRKFSTRLMSLFFHGFSVLAAILAMLLVFNAAGDWFLLCIILIFLLGVGWASINTIPQHVETVKLILNVGAVREGERIEFDGLPWKVAGLGLSARLSNPHLDGGEQVLPVKFLVGMHSRVPGEDEDWFPCRKGEWVQLPNDRIARVVEQTPSMVSLVELGGARLEYPTQDFMGMAIRKLSQGFRVSVTFGVDYGLQSISTTTIPAVMKQSLEAGLREQFGAEAILNVDAEFKEAAASSLDYQVEVDFDGECAPRFDKANRAISRILVEVCNEQEWEIPFQQITLHTAAPSSGTS